MAVLLYHVFAFLALFSYGIYHFVSATRFFFKPALTTSSSARTAIAGTGDYIARPYYPLLLSSHFHHLFRHIPLYFTLISLLISIAHYASLSPAFPNSFSSAHTAASLVFFFLITISFLLPVPLPPDLVFLLSAVAFALLGFASSAYQPSDLQSKCESISSSVSAASAVLSLALAVNSRLFVAELALAASISLQGLWSLQTGLTLYVERFIPEGCHRLLEVTDRSIRCELEESRIRAASILDLAFVLHTTFISIIAVAIYAVAAWGSGGGLPRRYNGGSYEALPTSSSSGGVPELDHVQMKIISKNSMQRFFLGGRLIFGPDARSMIFTIFLIIVPVILFAVFVSQRLVNEFQYHLGEVIVGIPVGFAFYVIVLLFLTASIDPGIIPRNTNPPDPEVDTSTLSWTKSHCGLSSVPPFKDVIVNGILVRVKFCHTCMLYRPPRCSHCSICNNCVERFDHHCPWVGQCIGMRNYRFFFMFISSSTILSVYVLTFCCVSLQNIMVIHECNLWEGLMISPVSGILIIYTFVVVWFVGGLTAFHIYLICTSQTTYENFRYHYDAKMNPYNHGCTQNFKEALFSRIPMSKNDFRGKIKEDINTFSTSLPLKHAMSPDVAKSSFGLEIDGKRQAVNFEEFEDIQSQISSMTGLDRFGTERLHASWGSNKGNWEIVPNLETLTNEFVMEHGFTETDSMTKYEEKI